MRNTLCSNPDEHLLIAQTLAGQSDPFWELVRPHLPSVSRMVRARMKNDCEAEDIVQNTLLKAFAQLRQFRFESSFRTWLTQIAINEIRQCYRSPVRARFSGFEECGIKENEVLKVLPSQLETCEQREKAERVGRAVASLPEKYRIVIELREFEQLSITATARMLRLTVSAVKTRQRRARLYMSRNLNRRRA